MEGGQRTRAHRESTPKGTAERPSRERARGGIQAEYFFDPSIDYASGRGCGVAHRCARATLVEGGLQLVIGADESFAVFGRPARQKLFDAGLEIN